jgi:pimeloyl-ACP methyl ester carboxylesterase
MEESRTFITADGAAIAYRFKHRTETERAAPRRTLVLLHGLASNMTRWSEFTANTRLAADCDLMRLDLRGHGGSLNRGRVGMEIWCSDLAALLRAENVGRAELVGHCLGANLALWFARRHPDMVSGLVLIEPMFRAALSGRMATVAAMRPLITALIPALLALAALGVHRRRLATLDLAELDRAARKAMAAAGGSFPTGRYASPAKDLRLLPLVIYLQDLLAVTGPLPDLTNIHAPVLSLLSTGGAFGDPQVTARLLAALPQGRIERLDALHWIPTEQPLAMREAIEGWCDRSG